MIKCTSLLKLQIYFVNTFYLISLKVESGTHDYAIYALISIRQHQQTGAEHVTMAEGVLEGNISKYQSAGVQWNDMFLYKVWKHQSKRNLLETVCEALKRVKHVHHNSYNSYNNKNNDSNTSSNRNKNKQIDVTYFHFEYFFYNVQLSTVYMIYCSFIKISPDTFFLLLISNITQYYSLSLTLCINDILYVQFLFSQF